MQTVSTVKRKSFDSVENRKPELYQDLPSGPNKSVQIRFTSFHVLRRTKIAFRALLSPLFDV